MRGVVTFVHDLGDYCLRHSDVFHKLTEEGFEVIAFDLRGHGKSSKLTSAVSFETFLVSSFNFWLTQHSKKKKKNYKYAVFASCDD